MSGPIVFISDQRIKPGQLEGYAEYFIDGVFCSLDRSYKCQVRVHANTDW